MLRTNTREAPRCANPDGLVEGPGPVGTHPVSASWTRRHTCRCTDRDRRCNRRPSKQGIPTESHALSRRAGQGPTRTARAGRTLRATSTPHRPPGDSHTEVLLAALPDILSD